MSNLDLFRKSLPIAKHQDQIVKSVLENQITIIAGETGCGKTTQVPQYLYEHNKDLRIVITQPRRIAAMTIAQRVSQEKSSQLGKLVGYSVRFDDRYSKEETKIKFVTDGMLIRELIIDPHIRQYNVVIIDEAHERTVQSDLLLALLKQLAQKRKDLRIVVMSATLETEKFSKYLKTQSIFNVEGRTFPIDIYNSKQAQGDYIEATVDTILQIHFEEADGDILAFLPGQEDIEDIQQILDERCQQFQSTQKILLVRPLYAALPPDIQMQAFEKTPEGVRKVVVSTNIAETSVTIDGIKYVVDCGYVKVRSYQSQKAIDSLLIAPISKAQAQQRAGRAGRQSRGKCFRLYTPQTYESLARFMLPEILRINLMNVILQMKAIGIKNVLKFDFIDQPDMALMLQNMKQLQQMGALDFDFNLTNHGRNMSQLPLEPQFSHLLLKAKQYDCAQTMLNVVAILEVDNIYHMPKQSKINLSKVLQKFKIPFSDHLTKAKILTDYVGAKNKKSFCKEYWLNQKAIKKALEIKQQLADYLKDLKLDKNQMDLELGDDLQRFLYCMSNSLLFKIAQYSPTDQAYKIGQSNQLAYIHPESVLFNLKEKPQFVVFNEVILTKKVYLRDLTQVPEPKQKLI